MTEPKPETQYFIDGDWPPEQSESESRASHPVSVDMIIELVTEALLTDGGHHKQWFLEQILMVARGCPNDDYREELRKQGYEWESGIAP